MIKVQSLSKTFGDPKSDKAVKAVDDVSFDVARRRDLRVPRPERRRQDHDDPDADDAAAADERHDRASTASIPRRSRSRCASASASCSRTRASTASSPPTRTWSCTACSITCRASVRTERIETLLKLFELWDRRDVAREDVLGRHEAPARDRARLAAHAEDPVPRRADARPRSAEPQPALDAREAPERDRRRHGVPDDALHGRGGARRRSASRSSTTAASSRRARAQELQASRPAPIRSRARS